MTALMKAINNNAIDTVRNLIRQGINVNELDTNQDAPLVIAAYKGYVDIVVLLNNLWVNISSWRSVQSPSSC